MLSKQLKELEIDGQVVPPKVEYSLTDFGSSVIPLFSLHEWNKKNSKTISNRLIKILFQIIYFMTRFIIKIIKNIFISIHPNRIVTVVTTT